MKARDIMNEQNQRFIGGNPLGVYNCLRYALLHAAKRVRLGISPMLWLWGWAIVASTLTLNQHITVDIVAGAALAVASFALFAKNSWFINLISRLFFPGLLKSGAINEDIYVVNNLCVNFYIMRTDRGGFVCFDRGWSETETARALREFNITPNEISAVFLTHHHWDHAGNADLFADAAIYAGGISDHCERKLSIIADNEKIRIDNLEIAAVAVPGHTSDSMAYLVNDKILFAGDAARIRNGGIVPFYRIFNRDAVKAGESLRKLLELNPEVIATAHTGIFHKANQ